MAYAIPTVADFKTYFVRDFPYGVTQETVMDADITNGLNSAGINFNESLWSSQANFNIGYLLLAAHYMVLSLRGSAQGLNGQYNWLEQSKSVGSVSQGFAIPEYILNNPLLSMLTKTTYGAKYLEFLLPQLSGQMFVVAGRTLP